MNGTIANAHRQSKFGSHSSYYASSFNQSEESLGNGLRDHVNDILAGLEEEDAQDAENTAEILAGNVGNTNGGCADCHL